MSQQKDQPLIRSVIELAADDPELATALAHMPPEVQSLLHHPERYTGDASVKAIQIAETAEKYAVA